MAPAWKPDVLIIALGTDDAKDENIAAHPGDFVPGCRALIAEYRTANPQAKIFRCPPPGNRGNGMVALNSPAKTRAATRGTQT